MQYYPTRMNSVPIYLFLKSSDYYLKLDWIKLQVYFIYADKWTSIYVALLD